MYVCVSVCVVFLGVHGDEKQMEVGMYMCMFGMCVRMHAGMHARVLYWDVRTCVYVCIFICL